MNFMFSRDHVSKGLIFFGFFSLAAVISALPFWYFATKHGKTEGRDILADIFNHVGDFPEAQRSTLHYLAVLASTVSYLGSVPIDPFMTRMTDEGSRGFGSLATTYIYADFDPNIPPTTNNNNNMNIAALELPVCEYYGIKPMQRGDYALAGGGPDGHAGSGGGINK